uniref:Uncharacterized protein n=1 Tax=Fagus sylvatica TaxID=28930 RepID=A0A2N9HR53_FAGSY
MLQQMKTKILKFRINCWKIFFREKFGNLEPPSTECRINRVPYHLRNQNNEAYTPHVISIGPIHHDKKKFQTTEKYKARYFRSFMQQVIKHENEIKLENLESTIKKMEDRIRQMEDRIWRCYVETVTLEGDDFVNMIMLDACFILKLIIFGISEINDPMRMEGWLFSMVYRELLLLENQLPFFVIEELYHLALPSKSNSIPLIQLTFEFFEELNIHKSPNVKIKHFTDLLRFFQLPPTNKLPKRIPNPIFPKYSVTQLHEAGVKFKVASRRRDEKVSTKCVRDEVPSRRILDLSFKNGVLEIPHSEFSDSTEALVRNIMALEQCDYISETYVTDFYSILDDLINTNEDVELLINKGILVNYLGDNNAVRSLINNLNRGIIFQNMNSEFCHLCEDLNEYYEQPWHRWKAMLRHQYFSTPWRSASTVAAIILLVLTLIQTVFSILK